MASVLNRIRSWWSPANVDSNKNLGPAMILANRHERRCRVYGCNRPANDPIHL
jgi:hypothetical protein